MFDNWIPIHSVADPVLTSTHFFIVASGMCYLIWKRAVTTNVARPFIMCMLCNSYISMSNGLIRFPDKLEYAWEFDLRVQMENTTSVWWILHLINGHLQVLRMNQYIWPVMHLNDEKKICKYVILRETK